IIWHLRLIVQLESYTMPNQLPDDTISILAYMFLYRISDITNTFTGYGLLNSQIQGFQRYTKQFLHLLVYFPHGKRISRIADITAQLNTAVYRYNVSVAQLIATGYSVHHLVVHRNTQ